MTEVFRTIIDETNQITTLAPTTHALVLSSPSGENLSLNAGSGFIGINDSENNLGSISGAATVGGSNSQLEMKEYSGVPGGDTFRAARLYATVSDKSVATWGTPGNTYDVGVHAMNIGGTPALALFTRKFNSSGVQQFPGLTLGILSNGLKIRSENTVYTYYGIDASVDTEFPDHDFQGTEYNFETPNGVALKVEDELVSANVPFKLPSYSVASLPSVVEGAMIYVADATGAHETGSLCFGNAGDWIDVTTGEAVV